MFASTVATVRGAKTRTKTRGGRGRGRGRPTPRRQAPGCSVATLMHAAPIAPPMRALLFAALLAAPLFALPHAAADVDVCTPDAVASLVEACASRHNYI